jgi:hypothetical protein
MLRFMIVAVTRVSADQLRRKKQTRPRPQETECALTVEL